MSDSPTGTLDVTPIDLLIVGGGPAALAAARGYRDAGGVGTVLILSADEHPPYNRPPLTKDYLRGEIEADELPLAPDRWYAEQQIGLQLRSRVVAIDRDSKRVRVVDQTGTERAVDYRRLVLATGSDPKPLPVPGAELPGVIYVRSRRSAEQMRAQRGPGRRVVVIGSGFVGCEAAASLARSRTSVVMVTDEAVPHLSRLGRQAGERIRDWLGADGVEVRTDCAVSAIEHHDAGWVVVLSDRSQIECDAVISASGAAPNVSLAVEAGLEVVDGAVATDASMHTSDPAIWAVGDIARATNTAAGRALRVEHWGEAEAMGEIAGGAIAGASRAWDSAPGFWSEIGDRTLKYSAWGDGYETAEFANRPGSDGWAVWYVSGGELVGVLSSDWDEAYDQGQSLIEAHARVESVAALSAGPAGERR